MNKLEKGGEVMKSTFEEMLAALYDNEPDGFTRTWKYKSISEMNTRLEAMGWDLKSYHDAMPDSPSHHYRPKTAAEWASKPKNATTAR